MRVEKSLLNVNKLRIPIYFFHSQTMGDKLDSQERNSSHPLVRSQKISQLEKEKLTETLIEGVLYPIPRSTLLLLYLKATKP